MQLDLKQLFQGEPFAVIGNFPYNISSQIIFKILDDIELVPQLVGMFQKEFADRVISMPGKKDYGIPSLLTQVYYNCEKWLDLAPELFDPPPKVWSSIISLKRKEVIEKDFDHRIFKLLIKQSFQNRRKMLRNTISEFFPNGEIPQLPSFSRETATLRPEQLHYQDFIYLSKLAKI